MRKILPIVGYPVSNKDVWEAMKAMADPTVLRRFMAKVGGLTQSEAVFTASSGNACFYVILRVLKDLYPDKSEVVLPAYTAPSLVVTIQKAGLKPVLSDIALDDFNADPDSVLKAVTRRTLCVIGVHMFGVPWLKIINVKRRLPHGLVIVEDGAQAFGASINSIPVGLFGDVAFWSFNRGKNLPVLTGGIATTFNAALAAHLRSQAETFLKPKSFLKEAVASVKCAGLRLAFDPVWYGALRLLIARFKETRVPADISLNNFSRFQAGFGLSLLRCWEISSEARFYNGSFLQKALKGVEGVLVPKEEPGVTPVFNRLPVVFKNAGHVEQARRRLEDVGIESSRMYDRPLHHIFNLGYRKSDFPNAVFLAEHLLTLPVHPLVTREHLDKMVALIKKTVRS